MGKTHERIIKYQSKVIEKICIECGTTFLQPLKLLAVCEQCKPLRKARLRPRSVLKCSHCNCSFEADRLNRKYCSRDCKYNAAKGRPSEKRGKKFPHLQRAERRSCLCCGETFAARYDFKGEKHERKQVYCSHRCYLKNRRVSKFEEKVAEYLSVKGIPLEGQFRVKRWCVDFRIVGTSLLVEADGSYWHSQTKERDRRKDSELSSLGFIVMRIDELEFYANPDSACEVIIRRWEEYTGGTAELVGQL